MGVTITELPPTAHFDMPTDAEAKKLREIVLRTRGWLRDSSNESEALRSVWVAGMFFRRPQPDGSRFFSDWHEIANRRLEAAGLAPISGGSLLVGVLAWADIPWQRHDRFVGAMLELGVNEFSGRVATNTWKDVLCGERGLLPPVLRDRGIKRQEGVHIVLGHGEYE